MRACLPVLPGVATFGLISGVAMTGAGLPPWVAILMSFAVFAGTAQLAAVQLLVTGAPLLVIMFAAAIINLRFVLYSLSMTPHLRREPARRRIWAAYLLSDNGFAHFIARYAGRPNDPSAMPYLLGASFVIWVAWQVGTIAGAVAGASVPAGWSLEFTVTLVFLALAVANLRDRASAAAAAAAGIVAAGTAGLPFKIGLFLAAAAGIGTGVAFEQWTRSRSHS